MPAKLKYLFNEGLIRSIAADISPHHPQFNSDRFVADCMTGLEDLELTPRAMHISAVMHRSLPDDFKIASRILEASLGPELGEGDGWGMEPLRYFPHMYFVARYGIEDFDDSMRFQYELTKRSTAEGSIRAFLEAYPERTYERLLKWTADPNMYVRRLVSEGTRPRLPWASRLRAFQDDPAPVVRLLTLLKDDPERYVQRSVANNLNDIAKDHPDLTVEVCKRWAVDATPDRKWIVRHALRSLVKGGHSGALEVMGYASRPLLTIADVEFSPPVVALGGKLRFSFDLVSDSDKDQRLLVDFAVHFVKADGKRRPKVFKLRELVLPAGSETHLEGSVSFAEMTTRKHRPGLHRIDLVVNGVSYDLGEFEVVP